MQTTHDIAIGGLQQVVVNLCGSVDKSKFDISVLCLRECGEFAADLESMSAKVFDVPNTSNIILL